MQRFIPATYRTVLIVSVLAVFAFLLLLFFRNLKMADESNRLVEHTYKVLLQADELSSEMKDMELAQLRYIMAGNAAQLAFYKTAVDHMQVAEESLRRLTVDNPLQQQRILELHNLIAVRQAIVSKRLETRKNQGRAAAESLAFSDNGIPLRVKVHALLDEVDSVEEKLLQQRKTMADIQSARTMKLTVVGSVVMLLLLTSINFVLEHDVALRRRAEQEVRSSEVLFRGMFDNASVGIALFSGSGRFELVNTRFCEITGYTSVELLSRTFQSIGFKADTSDFNPLDTLSDAASPAYEKLRCRRGNGTTTWVRLKLSALPISSKKESKRFISIIEDINAQVLAETSLKSANLSLTRSNESLQEFAYVASHDLQEPLRTVSMYSQLLRRECGTEIGEHGGKYLNIIADSTRRMSQLVSSLLAYAQASSDDKQAYENVNVEDLLLAVLQSLHASLEEQHASVQHDPMPIVYGDPVRLQQVFQNLVANALKYKQPESFPLIKIAVEKTAYEWIFHVRDNGIGFQPQYSERIFGIFKRLHNQNVAGTGVGLAVVKTVVHQHGGRVWAQSEGDNKGATFSFTIPLVQN